MDRLQWLEEQVIFLTRRVFALEKVVMRMEGGSEIEDKRSLHDLLEENYRLRQEAGFEVDEPVNEATV